MKKYFIYKDPNSQKFWNIEMEGNSFTVNYGKLATAGQTQTKTFADASACQKEADKLIAEKLKKGYMESTAEGVASAKDERSKFDLSPNEREKIKEYLLQGIKKEINNLLNEHKEITFSALVWYSDIGNDPSGQLLLLDEEAYNKMDKEDDFSYHLCEDSYGTGYFTNIINGIEGFEETFKRLLKKYDKEKDENMLELYEDGDEDDKYEASLCIAAYLLYELMVLVYECLVEFKLTKEYGQIPKADNFKIFCMEHDESFESALKKFNKFTRFCKMENIERVPKEVEFIFDPESDGMVCYALN